MALSGKERKEKIEIIHMMNSLFPWDEEEKPVESRSVSESVDGKIVNLKELQSFVDGKVPPYYGRKECPSTSLPIEISCLFFNSANKTLDDSKNFISLSIEPRGDWGTNVYLSSESSIEIGNFYGQAKKDSTGDGTKISDIVKQCDSDEIYNIYKKDALDIINRRLPTVYNLFTGGTITHQMSKNIRTLCVAYYPRLNKFVYKYNPDFILSTALDEWFRTKDNNMYKTLKDCYCYILAFVISHEMMHLIHHNNTSKIDVGANYDANDVEDTNRMRALSNIYTDSFINCQLSRSFRNISEVRCIDGKAPVLSSGIGDVINVRAEHNQGFKEYESNDAFIQTILKLISDILKEDISEGAYIRDRSYMDLKSMAGADVFIKVRVDASYSPLRTNSGIFQRFVNEVIKTITDGKVFSGIQISDAEKETDKAILANGSLVQVKGSPEICSVAGYDPESKKYTLKMTEMSDIKKVDMGDGMVQNIPIYTELDVEFGKRRRMHIRPFDPEKDGSWIEQSGERQKKTKLDDKEDGGLVMPDGLDNPVNNVPEKNIIDIVCGRLGMTDTIKLVDACMTTSPDTYTMSAADMVAACLGAGIPKCKEILGDHVYDAISKLWDKAFDNPNNEPDDSSVDEPKEPVNNAPVFHIGDIVWVRRLRKFGKIISMENGNFELVEMEEVGVNTLDDTLS